MIVPGFLVRKHISRGSGSLHVSEVEIIQDEETRRSIRQSLMEKHPGIQIEIWTAAYAQSPSASTGAGE